MDNQENVFKVGDRVYAYPVGWMRINEITESTVTFTLEKVHKGRLTVTQYHYNIYPYLSFTEYTLQGFTQQRPLPKIEKDTLVYVLDERIDEWKMRYFSHFEGNMLYAFEEQEQSTQTTSSEGWRKYSLTNPLEPCATKQG